MPVLLYVFTILTPGACILIVSILSLGVISKNQSKQLLFNLCENQQSILPVSWYSIPMTREMLSTEATASSPL